MRILYVTRRAWPAVGGIETLVHHIARGVSERHEIEIIALRIDNDPVTRTSDCPTLACPFEPFLDGAVPVSPLRLSRPQRLALTPFFLQEVPLIRRYAFGRLRLPLVYLYACVVASALKRAALRADVVHIWTDGFLAAAALRAARRAGRPAIITPFMHRRQWGDDVASVAIYKRADRVAALLDAEASDYRELGVDTDRIVVAGACSPGVGAPHHTGVLARHAITGPLVLYLGGRAEHKGVGILLAAARKIPASANITIAIAGPGPDLNAVRDGSSARVLDLGKLSDSERAEWLHGADVLCLPSAGETFGLVVLEAWSAGTPVLTSDIPALRQLVERSGGGRFVARDATALAGAICELVQDPVGLKAMGAAGLQYWRDHFTVDRVASWHESLYTDLCRHDRTV
jgi:glycosyltransferase involved in cell wall biosynthesis